MLSLFAFPVRIGYYGGMKKFVTYTYFTALALANSTPEERQAAAKISLLNQLGSYCPDAKPEMESLQHLDSGILIERNPLYPGIIRTSADVEGIGNGPWIE